MNQRLLGRRYGRDAFLRALVVQLAQNVESSHGPAIAEATVAQVGTDVDGRMEDAFRAERDISGDLDVGQVSSLLVELKAAIGGDFFIIDANDDRIVLGNNACPFGDAVMMAPALCRMTSRLFGGIARRNAVRPPSTSNNASLSGIASAGSPSG